MFKWKNDKKGKRKTKKRTKRRERRRKEKNVLRIQSHSCLENSSGNFGNKM